MTSPPSIQPAKRRRGRKRRSAPATRAPGAPLNLVAGSFDPDEPSVSLQFDRAINIGAIEVSAIQVNDDPH